MKPGEKITRESSRMSNALSSLPILTKTRDELAFHLAEIREELTTVAALADKLRRGEASRKMLGRLFDITVIHWDYHMKGIARTLKAAMSQIERADAGARKQGASKKKTRKVESEPSPPTIKGSAPV
jgi:hypothetical protein